LKDTRLRQFAWSTKIDRTVLVGLDIEGGKRLLEALDENGLDIRAAFWYYFPEPEEWRLVFATPMVDKEGPIVTYSRIRVILQGLDPIPEIPMRYISAVSPNSNLVKNLRSFIQIHPDNKSEHYLRHTIANGSYIDNAILYRIETADQSQ